MNRVASINITFGNADQFRCIGITKNFKNDYQFSETQLGLANVSPEIFEELRLVTVLMAGDYTVDHHGRLSAHLPHRAFDQFDRLLTSLTQT
jgi:hypothetical protein